MKHLLIVIAFLVGSCSFISLTPADSGLKTNSLGVVAKWSTIPIKVWYDRDLDPVIIRQATTAVNYVNDSLGIKLFNEPQQWPDLVVPDKALEGSVLLAKGYGVSGPAGATAHTRFDTVDMEIVSSTIYFYDGITDEVALFVIAVHELGHAIGLEHDYAILSIMNGHLYSAPPAKKFLTEHDISIIRDVYNIEKEEN